jgi:putative DNA primase/helicase
VIVVDTLHRFLAGDENSAQDAKTMLDACNALMMEFDCSVILVHHTGVSDEAQHRARGSSAWRGALDIEISIVPGKEGIPMQIVQRKSKDAEMAETVHVELQQVAIPGWLDEDGQQVTSAVIVQAQAPAPSKKNSKIDGHRKTFENAWWASGAEERNGLPYSAGQHLMDYFTQKLAVSEASPGNISSPACRKAHCRPLMAEIIEPFEHGWIVIDPVQASSMLIRKVEK